MASVPRSTQALLALAQQDRLGPAIDIGSYGGAVARALGCPYVHVDLTACEQARQSGAVPVLHADELPAGSFNSIWFDAREYEPGLAAEMIALSAQRLAPGGEFITTAPPAAVQAAFGQATAHGEAVVATLPVPLAYQPERTFYAVEFAGRTYQVVTAPGVFSPRGLDAGTRLMLSHVQARAGARLLDLGCGTGIVSRIAAEAWQCQVTAVDVNARALRLARANAPGAEVLASDGFRGLAGRIFDLVLTNPPYHTDFSVAREFIEGAFRHLTDGGMLFLVVKRSNWYVNKIRTIFGGCQVIQADGYTLIRAEKRTRERAATPAAPPTTRKHARRVAASSARRSPRG